MNTKHSRRLVSLLLVISGLTALACSGKPSGERERIATRGEELQSFGHAVVAVDTLRAVSASAGFGSGDLDPYWIMDERDAVRWTNDPDCEDNDCGTSNNPGAGVGDLCWALRNPDHFSENTLDSSIAHPWFGFGSPPASVGPGFSRSSLKSWIPRDNGVAYDWFVNAGMQMGSKAGSASRWSALRRLLLHSLSPGTDPAFNLGIAREAMRFALNACHYEGDRHACGHKTGNRWCDPDRRGPGNQLLTEPSADCVQFIEANRWKLLPEDQTKLASIIDEAWVGSGQCGFLVWQSPLGQRRSVYFSAGERFIRHRSRGVTLDEVDGSHWNNECHASCNTGECVKYSPTEVNGTEPEWGYSNRCIDAMSAALGALKNASNWFLSPSYDLRPGVGCRELPNHLTCRALHGTCQPNGSCLKYIGTFNTSSSGAPPEQAQLNMNEWEWRKVGTCTEGVSFGGPLPASCTSPVAPAASCQWKCDGARGFFDSDGECRVTYPAAYSLSTDHWGVDDITGIACRPGAQNGSSCETESPSNICSMIGGFCDYSGSCVNGDGANLGSCVSGITGFGPPCAPTQTTSTISYCLPGSSCAGPWDCCGLSCVPAQPFGLISSGGGGPMSGSVCASPSFGFDHLYYDRTGSGSGTVKIANFAGSTDCTDDCERPVPAGVPITLTALPAPGSSFVGWTGCPSSAGATCNVNASLSGWVHAQFEPGGEAPCNSGFWDVPSSHPFCKYIQKLREHGVSTGGEGCPSGYFCPSSPVSRKQMAAYVIRGKYGESFGYNPNAYFTDVPYWDPYFKYVQMLRDQGITSGCTTTEFASTCPSPNVTRGQMAVFLMRAKYGEASWDMPYNPKFWPPTAQYFWDVPPSHPFFRFVQQLGSLSITSGCETHKFCESSSITEGEAAVFVTLTYWPNEVPPGAPLYPL